MFLLDWYEKWLEIRANAKREVKEVEICQSCETLREQLVLERQTNQRLLDRIMEKPEKPAEVPHKVEVPRPILGNRHAPWRVRQQLLETEDREKAKLMRDAPTPSSSNTKTDVADLEKELNIASAERNAEAEKR